MQLLSRFKERIEQYLNIIYTSKLSEQLDKIFYKFISLKIDLVVKYISIYISNN